MGAGAADYAIAADERAAVDLAALASRQVDNLDRGIGQAIERRLEVFV